MGFRSFKISRFDSFCPGIIFKEYRLYFFAVFFIGFNPLIKAQQPQPPLSFETFKKELSELESAEKIADRYLQASMQFSTRIPDSVFALANEIRQLEGLNNQEQEAFYYFILANAWRTQNKDSVIHYAGEATNILKDLGEHDSYLTMENLLGLELSRNREFVKADSVFKNAIAYGQTLEEVEYPVKFIYGNLGSLYTMVGAHDLAITMYEYFLEEEDNPGNRCNIMSKLAVSLANINEQERAIELLSPCLEFDQLPPPIMAIVRSNLSHMYEELGDMGYALKLMEEAAEITSTHKVPNLQISHQITLGNKYRSIGDFEKAEAVRSKLEDIPNRQLTPHFKIDKNLFFAELEIINNNYEQAIKYANEAIENAENYNLKFYTGNAYLIKAKAYENLGEYEQALESERLNSELELSRHNKQAEENIAMMKVRYQLESKEAELNTISDQLQTVKVRNALVILFIILLAIYVLYRYRIHYLFREQLTRNNIARDLHDDLSGTLSSISFFSEAAKRVYIQEQDSGKYLRMIDKSAIEAKEKINDIIWAIDPVHDDWSTFLKKCKRFAADTFDSKNIDYNITMAENITKPLNLELRQNLWLIYKEIINNLVLHSDATYAKVEVYEKGKTISLKVEDNGKGFETSSESNRYGIKNIKYRADQIGASITLNSTADAGTTWIIEI